MNQTIFHSNRYAWQKLCYPTYKSGPVIIMDQSLQGLQNKRYRSEKKGHKGLTDRRQSNHCVCKVINLNGIKLLVPERDEVRPNAT